MTPSILVVDDDRYDNDRYCQVLRSAGYAVQSVTGAEQALEAISQQRFDVVLLDMLLPLRLQGRMDFGGIEVLRQIKERDPMTQVIAVTGYGSRELAAEAMAAGALDYITKDPDTDDRLPGSVKIAAVRSQLMRAGGPALDEEDGEATVETPAQLVADSAVMRQMLRRAQLLARIDSPLLIVGEPGSGKELIATVIHLNSNHANGPFKVVLCRSLSSDLVELWGSANNPGSGYCAQAEGGTLVLKGIQDLPFNQQKQLVSLVERQVYCPVGASEPIQSDLRVIATTTADLERMVRQGRFWRALYDALSVATLDVPALRERRDKDDILAIAGHLLRRYGLAPRIAPDAQELLAAHDYAKSNIKELEEILRSAALQSGGGEILPAHLPAVVRGAKDEELPAAAVIQTPSENVALSVRLVPSEPALLIWESHVFGNSRSSLHLPFPMSDLPLFLRALETLQWPHHPHAGPQFTSAEQDTLAKFGIWSEGRVVADVDRRIGQLLYQAIVADPSARSALDSARHMATEKSQSLALTLRFPADAFSLAALPWELIWNERQPLLLSPTRRLASCVRYLDIPQALPLPPATGRTLRLLAVCPAAGVPDHLYAAEESLRAAALGPLVEGGALTIEEIRPATISSLTDRLLDGEPVDILHFYGHGFWKDGLAYLTFDDGVLNANQAATLFGDIPLVVLYACRSATIGDDDMFTGIAPMLSAEGVTAVVAMQFTVGAQAANRFATIFYRNLAHGESVQMAVAKARQALYVEHRESWYIPVVYIRSRDMGPFVLVRK